MKVQLRQQQRRAESTLSVRSPLEPGELAQRALLLEREACALGASIGGTPRVQLFGPYVGRVHLPLRAPLPGMVREPFEVDGSPAGPVAVADGIPFADARAIARLVKFELEDEGSLAGPPEFHPYDSTFTVGRLAWPLLTAGEHRPATLAFPTAPALALAR
jgi:hypothetical protein